MFGSHSDLSGRGITTIPDQQSSSAGVYRPLGGSRTRSIGGSSDCSSSSLTSAPPQQNSEFSRHNSLRESSHSRVSQSSVFSSRQPSCDSADALNYSVHGPLVPTESGLRPRSIACMQRSGSSNSLRNNSFHQTDPRYYSLAAPSSINNRMEGHESFVHSMDERMLNSAARGGSYQRPHPHHRPPTQEELEPEDLSLTRKIKPSDPEYRKVAENLMSCSPQPPPEDATNRLGGESETQTRKGSLDAMEEQQKKRGVGHIKQYMLASFRSKQDNRRPLTPG